MSNRIFITSTNRKIYVECPDCKHVISVESDKHDKQVKIDTINKIIEYYKPCSDCNACLECDQEYFKKGCELDTRISYTELCEYLNELKEQ